MTRLFYLLASICQGLFLKQDFLVFLHVCPPWHFLQHKPTIDGGKATMHQVLQLE